MRRRFEHLAQEYQHRIYSYAAYCTGDEAEAQDVTQEVLLKLWRNLDKVQEPGVWPWLVRVTRNASIDVLRKRSAYRRLVEEDPEGEATARLPSRVRSPEEMVEEGDFDAHLRRALSDLAEPYRSIVVLREIQDYRYEEISAALELPLNTVKVYLHRGRRKLREALRGYVKRGSG